MPEMSLTLAIISVLLLFIGASFTVSLGLSSILTILIFKPVPSLTLIPQLFCESATSFILLCVPVFILGGTLMERGTIGRNLINFSASITNWSKGGLGTANIFGSMIFGGISGSSLADTATFGSVMVPMMEQDGYPKDYAAAVTLTSSSLSVVIPPSILILMAAAANDQSVSKALAGGLLPGLLITVMLMVPNYIISWKRNYGSNVPFSMGNVFHQLGESWTALIAPLIILGAIFTGVVTPTEAAGLAVCYVLVVDYIIFKKITVKEIIGCLRKSAGLTSSIMIIATSSALTNFVVAYEGIPTLLSNFLIALPGGKITFLIVLDIFLVIIGMTLDSTPAILVFTPLLLPVAANMGVDPTHFIVIAVTGLAIGLTTPPYGVCLFSVASVCKIQVDKLVKQAMPFYCVMFLSLIVITFTPELSLLLPRLFGL